MLDNLAPILYSGGMMDREQRAAQRLADIFSDERLNPIQMAHHTFELLPFGAEQRLVEWLEWHDRIASNGYSDEQLEFDFVVERPGF